MCVCVTEPCNPSLAMEKREWVGGARVGWTTEKFRNREDRETEKERQTGRSSRKMSFFEFWSNRIQQTTQLNLNASQRKRLLSDHEARAALQNESMVSLLPPVGTEVFRRFTPASLEEIEPKRKAKEDEEQQRKANKEENHHLSKPASDLQAGRTLPFIYGDMPLELLSIPLEDLDPFYQSQKTFMVLSKGNTIYRFNAESACYLLSPFNCLRTTAIQILLHPLFRLFILLTVLTNCGFMLIDVPLISFVAELIFLCVYICEVILKLLSSGFCKGRFTFIRDPWNWLDILIILTSSVGMIIYIPALGTIPVVMKIFACSPGLKKTVEGFIQSVKKLAGVIVLTTFCLIIMAMLGLQLFMGNLRNKCVFTFHEGLLYSMNTSYNYTDSQTGIVTSPENFYYVPGQQDALLCGNSSDSGRCPMGTICMKTSRNPNYGYTSYDSFWWSLLSMLRLLLQDFWDDLLMQTMRSAGKHSIIYFVLVFFPPCFILLSIIVAVVAMEQVEQERANAAEARQREEEFSRIVEVLRRREEEEEEESRRAGISEEQDSPAAQTQKPEPVSVAGGEEDHQPSCRSFAVTVLKGDCCGCCRWLKRQLRPFVLSPFFDLGIFICIILNIAFMAAEHYPMTANMVEVLVILYLVFTAIFTAEMVLKLVALGLHEYFKVSRNIFDFLLVIFSLLDLGLTGSEGLSVLGATCLLRALRLERWWPDLHLLMKTVWTSIGNLSLVLIFMVFLFSVVGTQLFQEDNKNLLFNTTQGDMGPRWHMDDFFNSFLLIFRVLSGQWIEPLWECMEVSNDGKCVIFFMTVLIIGRLLILSLFLNLLLSSLCNAKLAAPSGKETNNLQTIGKKTRTWIRSLRGNSNQTDVGPKDAEDRKDYLALTPITCDDPAEGPSEAALSGVPVADPDVILQIPGKGKAEPARPDAENQTGNTPEDCCCDGCYRCCTILDLGTSPGAGKVWSRFRRACFLIVQHKVFEVFIIFIILLSCVVLVFEDIYLEYRPTLQMVLDKANLVFTYVFLLEMLLKWIALGFKKYFSNFWCWLDFLILDVSLICLMANMMGYSTQPMRALGALRTLRTPARFKGMKVVLRAMLLNLPSMFRALLVSLFVWLFFSILGINLFAGKLTHCYNETSEEIFLQNEVHNKTQCFELIMANFTEVRWKNMEFNFDNVGTSFLSLLITATSAGWLDILYSVMDSTQVESQPAYKSNLFMSLYLIFFWIFGCFYTWNLFIRVFIDSLHQQRNQLGKKHVFMTEEQQKYSQTMMEKFSRKPKQVVPRPQSCCLACFFDLVTAPWFEVVMVMVICVNMLLLMVETDNQSSETEAVLHWLHFAILIIFLIEFILKIIALRKHYFSSCLNILDFVVLLRSIIDLGFADLLTIYFIGPSVFLVLRLGRVIRILLNIRWAKGIRKLLLGFMMSLPALRNIGLLFFLVLFTYSYIGMCTFAHVREALIDNMFNFETFGNSMISMILVSTTSSWEGFLLPIMTLPPDCDPIIGDCGSPTAGIIFFSSYILLYILLMVHIFITVILESFNSRDLEGDELLSDKHLQMFYDTWRKFDPEASQVMQYSELSNFYDTLQDPLRIPKPNTIRLILMDIPLLPGDKVRCLDVLHAVMEQVFCGSEQKDALKARLEEKFIVNNPSKVSDEPISSTLRRKQEEVAAAVIQRAFRKCHLQDRDETSVGGASDVLGSSVQ
ncbi:sodium channel protein type 4 subunit alpha B-like [Melanotaenia boesemani]|uniref:sodium channel protein type 4 subunit alpha B-like n=1 Tax=Melanotaenia boesemani TaxID=1250792 RepID=UPI001C03EE91|nr:sodium channel protein type 4 subunit alpha B-like [Melanotaenia boesemani]